MLDFDEVVIPVYRPFNICWLRTLSSESVLLTLVYFRAYRSTPFNGRFNCVLALIYD